MDKFNKLEISGTEIKKMGNYRIVKEIDRKQWSEFVYNHPNGNIFQIPEMYNVYSHTKNYEPLFLAVESSNKEILAIFLAVIQKEYFSFLGNFTARSIIFGSPLLKTDNPDVLNSLLYEYNDAIQKKVIYSQFRNFWSQGNEKTIFEKHGFFYEEHLNILLDLTLDQDILWNNLSNSRRKGIRKAKGNNFVFGVTSSQKIIPIFYDLLKNTYKHSRLPHPKIDFFYSIHKELSPDKVKYFTLCKDQKNVVVLVALIFKNRLYGFYMGTIRDNEYLKMRPVDLFFWELLCWAKENGCKTYDWLGAGRPDQEYGVRKFKLQYGGIVVEMGRYEKVHKPFMMKMGKLGMKIRQRKK